MEILLAWAAIAGGLVLLVWSAEIFIRGSADLAKGMGLSPLFVGMVIVGFGTSAPEMMISSLASLDGKSGIVLGNAYGSNIVNIALILGLAALVRPIPVARGVLRYTLPVLILVSFFAAVQLLDGLLSRTDAFLLLAAFSLLMFRTFKTQENTVANELLREIRDEKKKEIKKKTAIIRLVAGFVLLVGSSRIFVWGAVNVAQALGVSDLVIGLTIVALGTSLPELASSMMAAYKGEDEIALGNILGSNLFNTMVVTGIAGLIRPVPVEEGFLARDAGLMLILTLALWVMGFRSKGRTGRISRMEGGILLLVYLGYTGWLVRISMG